MPAEALLVDQLRAEGDAELSLVAVDDDVIVGHVMFPRMTAEFRALGLGPVAVLPDRQRSGVVAGSRNHRSDIHLSAGQNLSASSDFALARVMNDAPHPLGSERHLNLRDAEFRKGVDHRIDDCGETACAAGFAAALGTQRIGFRG